MKKMMSLAALSMAALGTTLWAQQSDEPPPAEGYAGLAASAGSSLVDPLTGQQPEKPAEPARAAAGALPALSPSAPFGTQSARPNSARPSSSTNGTNLSGANGSLRSVGAQAKAPRPDLDVDGGYGPATYVPNPNINYAVPPGGRYPAQYSVQGNAYVSPPIQHQYYKQPSPEEQRSAQEFRDTVLALRQAKTDEDKADVRAKLNDLVSKQIDQDLAEREKRLNELEAKAKQLRDQLQQRKQTKAEIQKMLVMLIENPQGGLGLPASWMNAINQPIYSFPSTEVYPTYTPAATYSPN